MGRRRRLALGIVLFLVVSASVLALFKEGNHTEENLWQSEVVTGFGGDEVVQLFLDGIISETPGFNDSFSLDALLSQLEQAKEDQRVRAVVLRVNSPGGEVVASDELYRKVKELSDSGKPVVVSMGGVAASGGYYVSAAADRIVANPATLTGSLGVIFTIPNYQGLAEWIGYSETVIKSGALKDMGSPLREMHAAEREVYQSLVDESYARFVDIIAEGRSLSKDDVRLLADGRIYSGQQALELGLVDSLGTLQEATEEAMRLAGLSEALVVRYAAPFRIADLFGYLFFRGEESLPLAELRKAIPLSDGPKLMYLYRP